MALAFVKGALAIGAGLRGVVGARRGWSGDEWLALGGLPARAFEAVVLAAAVRGAAQVARVPLHLSLERVRRAARRRGLRRGAGARLRHRRERPVRRARRPRRRPPARALRRAGARALRRRHGLLRRPRQARARRAASAPRCSPRRALACAIAFHGGLRLLLRQLRGIWMYGVVAAGSLALWVFVLRRVHHAQEDSPFKRVTRRRDTIAA